MKDFFEIPYLENVKTVTRTECIFKQYFEGMGFVGRPVKARCVSYIDAESSISGTQEDGEGKIIKFTCDRCKKLFSAKCAHAIRIKLPYMPIGGGDYILDYKYERAFCGKCAKKAKKLSESIYKSLCEFDSDVYLEPSIEEDETL